MPIGLYHYKFSVTETASPAELTPEKRRGISRALGVKDWLYLPYSGGCRFFLTLPLDHLDGKVIKVLRHTGLIPPEAAIEKEILVGREPVRHLLEIATGLLNGNNGKKLLTLLHEAYLQAAEHGHIGLNLQRLVQQGIWLHEKARQETAFFQYAVTPEAVFAELAGKILGSLNHTTVAVVGSHPALPQVVDELCQAGCEKFAFLGSEQELMPEWASAYNSALHVSAGLTTLPAGCNIVIVYPSRTHRVSGEWIRQIMEGEKGLTRLVFDCAESPLDFKKLKRYDNLYLYTHKDIENAIRFNKTERQESEREIERWIEAEVDTFFRWHQSEERYQFAGIIGNTPQMQRIFEMISRIARTDITVLIDGESGTGKELVARAIHDLSARAHRPFKVVNCGAIPDNLLESELFGHVRGAFTGAVAQKAGLFESADSGTIFLDEIGELPQHLQVKLLRVLQEGEFKRVGSTETTRVDVRVLAATNKNLEDMVPEGTFRSDLYYRLNVIQLTVPPLRERQEDIPLLVKHFIRKYAQKLKKDVIGIAADAQEAILAYAWPGNIRELENAIERSVALAFGNMISCYDLPPAIYNSGQKAVSGNGAVPEAPLTLKELEKKHILETLEACDWNYELASKQLAIGRTTLWRKLKEYQVIDDPE